MPNGYAKFRRGLVDHLLDGRISADEYCIFSLILQLADFHSGMWRGSGMALSSYVKWCPRQCQVVLRSLERKAYLKLWTVPGRKGNYPIIVRNYHGKTANGHSLMHDLSANGDAVKEVISEWGCGDKPGSANGDATLKEVIHKKRTKPKKRATPAASPLLVLPEGIPADAWEAYVEARGVRHKITTRAAELIFKKLLLWKEKGQDPKAVLEQSVMNGWTGIFELKERTNGRAGDDPNERFRQTLKNLGLDPTAKPS